MTTKTDKTDKIYTTYIVWVLPRTDMPDLRIRAVLLGSAESEEWSWSPRYSGQPGRWDALALFRTEAGKYVARWCAYSRWAGATDMCAAEVCDTPADVRAYLGHGWLARELYEAAGIGVGVIDVA